MSVLELIKKENIPIPKNYREENSIEKIAKDLNDLDWSTVNNDHLFNLKSVVFPQTKTVSKIEFIDEIDSGDIEINGIEHSYLANGTPVHNTINLPEDYKSEDLADVLLDYVDHLKGVTIYQAGSRGDEPLKIVNWKEIEMEELIATANKYTVNIECKDGVCEI